MKRFLFWLLQPRKQWLWHPDSPGMKVLVVRTRIGRLLKPRDFATISEDYLTDGPGLPPLLVLPPRSSRYLDGGLCDDCGADNPDEDWPCSDTTHCEECGAKRPLKS